MIINIRTIDYWQRSEAKKTFKWCFTLNRDHSLLIDKHTKTANTRQTSRDVKFWGEFTNSKKKSVRLWTKGDGDNVRSERVIASSIPGCDRTLPAWEVPQQLVRLGGIAVSIWLNALKKKHQKKQARWQSLQWQRHSVIFLKWRRMMSFTKVTNNSEYEETFLSGLRWLLFRSLNEAMSE